MKPKKIITYAQNREDLFIKSFFVDVDKGFYVDVGAHHPVFDSVTKFFYKQGWTGINIEPQKKLYEKLVKDRSRDTNLNIGVSNKTSKITLREYPGGGLSTFSKEIKNMYEHDEKMKTVSHQDYEVPTLPLRTVFSRYAQGKRIHFLKVDVEGFEYEVLEGNDWDKYRPELVCVEANHIVKDWRPLLEKVGYVKVFHDGLNEYHLAKESLHRQANLLSYPKLFLSDQMVVPYILNRHLDTLQRELKKQYARVNELWAQYDALQKEHHKLRTVAKHSVKHNLSNLKRAVKYKVGTRKDGGIK